MREPTNAMVSHNCPWNHGDDHEHGEPHPLSEFQLGPYSSYLWQRESVTSLARPEPALTRDTSFRSDTDNGQLLPPRPSAHELSQPIRTFDLVTVQRSPTPPPSYLAAHSEFLRSFRDSQGWEEIELQEIRREHEDAQQGQSNSRSFSFRVRGRCRIDRTSCFVFGLIVILVAMIIVMLYAEGVLGGRALGPTKDPVRLVACVDEQRAH